MTHLGQPEVPSSASRYDALIILFVLSVLEIGILYVLIAVETPVTPVVRRAIQNPGGLFAVVMSAVTLLCLGMAAFLTWAERYHRRRQALGPVDGSEDPPRQP